MGHGLASITTAWAGLALTWFVQSSVLLAFGLVLGRLFKRYGPAVQSGVYRTTLLAVMVCPLASGLLARAGFEGLAIRFALPERRGNVRQPENASAPVLAAELAVQVPEAALATEPMSPASTLPPSAILPIKAPESPAAVTEPRRIPDDASRTDLLTALPAWILLAWLAGSGYLAVRFLVGQRRMSKVRAAAFPVGHDVLELCRETAARLRVTMPEVLRSPFLFSPCLDGLRRPVILLPEDVSHNLRETFVHELAHLVRHDGLWNLLRCCTSAALWVQPLLWVLSRRLEATAEEVCDDYVVQFGADRTRYADHLLQLAGRALPPVAPASVGMISLRSMLAQRVVRILDTSRSLSTRAGKPAVAAMFTLGLAGTVLAGLLGSGGVKHEALAQSSTKEAEVKAKPKDKTIRGQVVGPDGRPVPGATVIASRVRPGTVPDGVGDSFYNRRPHELIRKTADQQGRFELAFEPTSTDSEQADEEDNSMVLAKAPGFGLGLLLKDSRVRLSEGDVPINGRIVDLEGRPVAGVKVRIIHLYLLSPEARREADARSGPYKFPGARSLGLDGEPALPGGIVTDADGRFRIEGLGRDTMASLEISGQKTALKQVEVLARVMERTAGVPRHAEFVGFAEPGTYGANCTIAVEPSRPIEGLVRDAETRRPIPGAVVTLHQLSGSLIALDGTVLTQTDAQGRYRLTGLPKARSGGHKLAVYPPLDQPYFITRDLEFAASPGLDPVTHDIALKRGVSITGKITDLKTGKPVQAAVDYFPLLSNIHARDYPNFDPRITASVAIKTRYRTDREGRFQIPGLPGLGVVTAHTDDRSYRVGVGAETIAGRTDQDQLPTYDHIYPSMYQGLKAVNVPEGARNSGPTFRSIRGARSRSISSIPRASR